MIKEETDFPFIQVPVEHEAAVKAEIRRRKGHFITDFVKNRRGTQKQAEEAWERLQEAKAVIREFEDRMSREIAEWTPLEKAHLAKLEAEGWDKKVIENTLAARKRDFDRAQNIVKTRIKASEYDVEKDFRESVLNPATRREALERFLHHHVHKNHFLLEALELLWSEVDNLKAKRR